MVAAMQSLLSMELKTTAPAPESTAGAPRAGAEAREIARRLGAVMFGTSSTAGEFLRTLEESGLTLTQCKVLTALGASAGGGPRAAKDIADPIGASLPTVSRAVDVLVRRNLVRRVADTDDRRVRNLVLTDGGERLVRQLLATRIDGLAAFIADLTPTQRRKLAAALDSLLEREEIARAYRELQEDSQ
jgi:DNA-binding MarR family transcriptional regulator